MDIFSLLTGSLPHLPEEFRKTNERIFQEEHLVKIAQRLESLLLQGIPEAPPLPHLKDEVVISLREPFSFFEKPLQLWKNSKGSPPEDLYLKMALSISQAGCGNLLLLLGQRRTPASLVDERAIPPLQKELMASALQEYSQGLTAVGRAWTKHSHRSKEIFWGTPSGTTADKNNAAIAIVEKILSGVTWWNIFGHFQHETVFEARLPTGHGARWKGDGSLFIGFLEPFDEAAGF